MIRVGGRRSARVGRVWRRLVGRVAVLLAVVLALTVAVPQQRLGRPGQDLLPLSWLWDWFELPASWASPPLPPTPQQESAGSAAGLGHSVPTESTRAGGGAGRAPGKGVGQLDEYRPHKVPTQPVNTPAASGDQSFDAARSRRIPAAASATSDVYENPDGSFTRKVYPRPVNFRNADGTWTPIDTSLSLGTDGRVHEGAHAHPADFAGVATDPVLASLTIDTGHRIGYGLRGAADVTATVSGSTLTYPGVLTDTDLRLTTLASGFKESLVLRSPAAGSSWVFPLHLSGVGGRVEADGSVAFTDEAGTVLARIPHGWMSDSRYDPRIDDMTRSDAVSYELTTVDGQPALRMSVDAAWLNDPARVFPVTVDPTVSDTAYPSGTTYAQNGASGDHSAEAILKAGTSDGGAQVKAYSFLGFVTFGSTYAGARFSSVSLKVFVTWAWTCTPKSFSVNRVTQLWTPSGLTSYPGPSFDGTALGSASPSVSHACGNTNGDPAVGDWATVSLSTATFTGWSAGTVTNYGLAITASQSDSTQWKKFDSVNGPNPPYLSVTYTPDETPVIDRQYPANNSAVDTLRPELLAYGHDPDNYPASSVNYFFSVYDDKAQQVVNSGWVASGAWQVPNDLQWGKTYFWTVQSGDGLFATTSPAVYAFRVEVPQPGVTSKLSQNSDNGLDPSIGNYTTSATDVAVLTVGPALSVRRSYNSKDPRVSGGFGAGWSSVLDARAVPLKDSGGAVRSVVVTYPEGQQVGFGRNSDGSFTSPSGRFASFTEVTTGSPATVIGYKLIDKNDTEYKFTQSLPAGGYGISSITDVVGRALVFGYDTNARVATVSSASGRKLYVTWYQPSGAAAWHVQTVYTDPAVAGDSTTVQTWTYTYTGDKLTKVCPPTSSTACTTYGYTSGSQHPNTALDIGAKSYWRLGETSGTVAASSVLTNEHTDDATYTNVTLGQPAALAGSTVPSAGFNGTSSYVTLPTALVTNASYQSVSLWFKTTGSGVLFSYNGGPVTGGLPANYTPALYVGSDGKLYGEFWHDGGGPPIASTSTVNNGAWHHAVLAGDGGYQVLYLDGTAIGNRSGSIHLYDSTGSNVNYLGTGFVAGAWPGQPANPTPNHAMYFTGSISDVSFFNDYLDQDEVSQLYGTGHVAAQLLSSQTRPSGNSQASLTYDPVTGHVAQLTDGNGGTWTMATPTAIGSSQVYASSVLAATPADYWRLRDTGGSTAVNEVKGATATYSTVTLGATGSSPFDDATGGTFNGTSSYLRLPTNLLPGSGAMSVGMWFKTSGTGGILMSQQASALGSTLCPCMPLLWVGSDGTLRGVAPATLATGPMTGMANKCLDLSSYGTADGTKVQLWDCTGAWNQVWQPQPDGRIKNPNSGKCLDVSGGGTTNGTFVQLWNCNAPLGNQTWQPQPDGSWKNPQSNKCLDLQGPSSANSTQAWIWDCYGGAGQKWKASLSSSARVDDNKWHHVVLTSDGTEQTLYLDGAKQGSSTGPALTSTSQPYVYVGAGRGTAWAALPTTTDSYFNGAISDVAFYRNEVPAGQVAAQYGALKYSDGPTPVKEVNVTDPGGKTITYHYDLANGGRLVSRKDGLNYTTRYGYDARGFLNTVTDPNGVVTTTGHDVRGNTVSRTTCQNQTANLCSTTYYEYFPNDTDATLNPNPRNDQLVTMRDARSSSATDNTYLTTYTYDEPTGLRTGVTTPAVTGFPNGRATTTTYTTGTTPAVGGGTTPPGLPITVTSPGGAVQTTAYYSNGDIASVTDPVGKVTSYTYDLLGRPTSQTVASDSYPSGLTTTTSFDKMNRLRVQTDPPVTNRVTGAVHTRRATTTYDGDGNVTSQLIEDTTGGDASRTVSATFNNHDQQITSTDPANNTTTFGYDVYGNKNKAINPAGTETDYLYDCNGHLLTTTLKNYTGDPVNPSPAADLVQESRAYDPAGRLGTVTDSMGWVTAYTYADDGLTATVTRSDPAHPGTSFVVESNTYDAAGSLTSKATNNGTTTTNVVLDAANRTLSSTLDPTGANRVTTYTYSPDDAVLSTRMTGSGGAANVDASYDAMGRITSRTVYNDAASHPNGWWKLNETSGPLALDSSGAQQTGTLSSGVSWSGGAAAFDGTSGTVTTAGPVLDTTQSFSVSAWVTINNLARYQTAVTQDAGTDSGFVLQYRLDDNRWAFMRMNSDVAGATPIRATSTAAPTTGTWVHLVGVFNATNGGMTLYVNGAAQGTATDTTPINARGSFALGREKVDGILTSYFNGQVDNVQVYPRAVSSAEVSTLYGYGRTGGALSTNRLTTTWNLDKRGLPTSVVDPNANTTTYTYDEAGRLAVTTAPTVNTETNGGTPVPTHPVSMVGYDTFGATTETSDPNGDVTTTGYDADGRPASVTLPNYTPPGGTTITAVAQRTYNALSQVTTSTDPLGHQASYGYDQLGNLATVTAPNTGATHYTYDTEGDQLSVTDANGAVNQATYDYLGRKATTTRVVRQPSSAAYTTTYAYNTPGGWLSSVTTPGSAVTSYGHDNVGETTTVTDAANNTSTNTYDYAGRKTKTILPDGTGVTATFDTAGRQTGAAKLDTDGATVLVRTSAGYDSNGNKITTTDGRGHTNTFTYDATNRLTTEVQPLSTSASITTSFGYDPAGNRTRFTDGRGNPFITTYNTWNLPESQIEPSTPAYPNAVDRTFTTVYNAAGQVANQTAPGGVNVTDTYNTIGNLTGQTGTGADAGTTDRTFGYDTGGRLTSASAPGGTDVFTLDDRGLLLSTTGPSGASSFVYNGDGLMTSRTDAAGTTSYTYDTADRLKTVTDPATSAVLTYTYNTLSQPSQISYGASSNYRAFGYDHKHRLTSDTLKTSGGSTIASITYGYDSNDNVANKTTTGFTGSAANIYTYDWANRLTSWNNGTNTSGYGYDNSGNRTQSGTQTFTYNARNQLLTGAGSTYTYTARGTLASVTTGGSTVTATNDAFGQTITQGTQTYTYDALGRVITDATSGGGNRTLTYTGAGNTLAGDGGSTYSRDPGGGLVGIKTGASGVLAWTDKHTDVVGNFTATGTALTGSTTYGPLGTIVATAGMAGNLGYQSGFTESASAGGRVNMAARWYNPATGQFDNRDSVGNNPVPNSANANRYGYAKNNPLTSIDPDGHIAFDTNDDGSRYYIIPEISHGHRTGGYHYFHRREPCHNDNACSNHMQHSSAGPPDFTGKVENSRQCGSDLSCNTSLKNQIEDVANRIREQMTAALDSSHCSSLECFDGYRKAIGAFNWVGKGDGTYVTTDGYSLLTVTDHRLRKMAIVKPAPTPCPFDRMTCLMGGAGQEALKVIKSVLLSYTQFSTMSSLDQAKSMLNGIKDWITKYSTEDHFSQQLDLLDAVVPVKDLADHAYDAYHAAKNKDYVGLGGQLLHVGVDLALAAATVLPVADALGSAIDAARLADAAYAAARAGVRSGARFEVDSNGVATDTVEGDPNVLDRNPLDGTRYTPKVLQQAASGDYHGFPEIADTMPTMRDATVEAGGDGIPRMHVRLLGEYDGKQGVFHWIIEQDGSINHRLFEPFSK